MSITLTNNKENHFFVILVINVSHRPIHKYKLFTISSYNFLKKIECLFVLLNTE